ncbi:hypothetical protein OE88DRAFT_1650397 [Heliocybe sulcata]|uniref:Uncharacterized protein n=1 Tax=Heliocybe sulcata TaxID=5364 RepID=A0A5C3NL74_9AGAM|nr:hypothetical protein OE88DRAFT_1650397 [Heliocybe sulcata]
MECPGMIKDHITSPWGSPALARIIFDTDLPPESTAHRPAISSCFLPRHLGFLIVTYVDDVDAG